MHKKTATCVSFALAIAGRVVAKNYLLAFIACRGSLNPIKSGIGI